MYVCHILCDGFSIGFFDENIGSSLTIFLTFFTFYIWLAKSDLLKVRGQGRVWISMLCLLQAFFLTIDKIVLLKDHSRLFNVQILSEKAILKTFAEMNLSLVTL